MNMMSQVINTCTKIIIIIIIILLLLLLLLLLLSTMHIVNFGEFRRVCLVPYILNSLHILLDESTRQTVKQ